MEDDFRIMLTHLMSPDPGTQRDFHDWYGRLEGEDRAYVEAELAKTAEHQTESLRFLSAKVFLEDSPGSTSPRESEKKIVNLKLWKKERER